MDGKQARRTKSSSALGELFDHGVDSWACFLFPVCIFSVLSRDNYGFSPMAMHLLLWAVYISFIDSHWEKYNTKVLFLPWSYDISMLVRITFPPGDSSLISAPFQGDDDNVSDRLLFHAVSLTFRSSDSQCAIHASGGTSLGM